MFYYLSEKNPLRNEVDHFSFFYTGFQFIILKYCMLFIKNLWVYMLTSYRQFLNERVYRTTYHVESRPGFARVSWHLDVHTFVNLVREEIFYVICLNLFSSNKEKNGITKTSHGIEAIIVYLLGIE